VHFCKSVQKRARALVQYVAFLGVYLLEFDLDTIIMMVSTIAHRERQRREEVQAETSLECVR